MMKSLLLLFSLLLISSTQAIGQTAYSQNDIQGEWLSNQGYSITVKGQEAHLSSLGKTNFPAKLQGDLFYANIKHVTNNQWTANRYQWKYTSTNIEDGRWVDEGTVNISMSADKNSFSQASRKFSRVTPIQQVLKDLPENSKKVVNVDYSGVAVEYILAKTSTGKMITHAKAKNTHKNLSAILTISSSNKVIINQRLEPGFGFTGTIPADDFNIMVTFEAVPESNVTTPDLIQLIKSEIGQYIQRKDDNINLGEKVIKNKKGAIGARG